MQALIFNNMILDVTSAPYHVAAPLRWEDCPDDVTTEWTYTPMGNVFSAPPIPSVNDVRARKLSELAAYRYAREIGGFMYSGMHIATDDRSKTLLSGARQSADAAIAANQAYTVSWKTREGWIDLNAAQIVAISNAVRDFIQDCFDAEKAHYLALMALNIREAIEGYDFKTAFWPN